MQIKMSENVVSHVFCVSSQYKKGTARAISNPDNDFRMMTLCVPVQ